MGELLLQHGADIDTLVDITKGYTLLMQFCGVSMQLEPIQLEINLEVINFLLEHGADGEYPSHNGGYTAWDLCEEHSACDEIRAMLSDVKQVYFHPNLKAITETQHYLSGLCGYHCHSQQNTHELRYSEEKRGKGKGKKRKKEENKENEFKRGNLDRKADGKKSYGRGSKYIRNQNQIILDEKTVKVGCCSLFSFK